MTLLKKLLILLILTFSGDCNNLKPIAPMVNINKFYSKFLLIYKYIYSIFFREVLLFLIQHILVLMLNSYQIIPQLWKARVKQIHLLS